MPKYDRCPVCRVTKLVWNGAVGKFTCSRYPDGCQFIDRRYGSSFMDPVKDQRGQEISAWDNISKWEEVR